MGRAHERWTAHLGDGDYLGLELDDALDELMPLARAMPARPPKPKKSQRDHAVQFVIGKLKQAATENVAPLDPQEMERIERRTRRTRHVADAFARWNCGHDGTEGLHAYPGWVALMDAAAQDVIVRALAYDEHDWQRDLVRGFRMAEIIGAHAHRLKVCADVECAVVAEIWSQGWRDHWR